MASALSNSFWKGSGPIEHTWKGFDIIGWQSAHHLGVNPDAVFIEWVELPRELYHRYHGLLIWIKVIAERILAFVDIVYVASGHADFVNCKTLV